jgi:FtsH-binding integral membrane protein
MFIGHFAAGMMAKKVQPSISLGAFFLAAQFLDLLWPTLLLLGVEHVAIAPGISKVTPLDFTDYPISHSLLMVIGWSLGFSIVYYLVSKNKIGSILLGALVLSHWLLDLVVHIPDLPLYPGDSPKVGMGLWNSTLLTILLEGVIFISGIWIYLKTKRDMNQKVNTRFWSLIVFLVIVHVMNFIGPPPPSVNAIAWAGHLQWLFIPWAWWADRSVR